MLSEHNYPTLEAQERLNYVLSDNNDHDVSVKNIVVHNNGLVTFMAEIGGTYERHVLTTDDSIYMYWDYLFHNGLDAVPE